MLTATYLLSQKVTTVTYIFANYQFFRSHGMLIPVIEECSADFSETEVTDAKFAALK